MSGVLTPNTLGTINSPGTVGSAGCINVLAPSVMASSTPVAGRTSTLSSFDDGGMIGTTSTIRTIVHGPERFQERALLPYGVDFRHDGDDVTCHRVIVQDYLGLRLGFRLGLWKSAIWASAR